MLENRLSETLQDNCGFRFRVLTENGRFDIYNTVALINTKYTAFGKKAHKALAIVVH